MYLTRSLQKDLPHLRLGGSCGRSDAEGLNGDRSPPKDRHVEQVEDISRQRLERFSRLRRNKENPHRILARWSEGNALTPQLVTEEKVRNLQQDTGTIS